MPSSSPPRVVHVDLPAEAFVGRTWDAADVARELRVLFLVELVRDRRLAYGKAAELAGLPIADFMRVMGRHAVTPFDYDEAELERELA
jgi:predicted HTH domain antitoxin